MSKKRKRENMTNLRAAMLIAEWASEHDNKNYDYYKKVGSRLCYWHMIYVPTGKTEREVNGPWRPWLRKNYPDIYKIVWPNE